MLTWAILALGCGLVSAVLFVFFRDIRPLVQFGLMVVFFTSPSLFKVDLFSAHSFQARLLAWHPMTYLAALFQKPMYSMTWPSVTDWAVSLAVSLGTLGLGLVLHERLKRRFYYYL
jgi:ABC-type polysaccharide/polyol phosphate export permease